MPSLSAELKPDPFGIYIALIGHKLGGGDCDALTDPRLFPGRLNDIWAKTELAVDENFGGNWTDFLLMVLGRACAATLEEDVKLLAIEHWLDVELKESAKLYG